MFAFGPLPEAAAYWKSVGTAVELYDRPDERRGLAAAPAEADAADGNVAECEPRSSVASTDEPAR